MSSSRPGLLLLNLGVYGGCEIMFDSKQVPSSQFPPLGSASGSKALSSHPLRDVKVNIF